MYDLWCRESDVYNFNMVHKIETVGIIKWNFVTNKIPISCGIDSGKFWASLSLLGKGWILWRERLFIWVPYFLLQVVPNMLQCHGGLSRREKWGLGAHEMMRRGNFWSWNRLLDKLSALGQQVKLGECFKSMMTMIELPTLEEDATLSGKSVPFAVLVWKKEVKWWWRSRWTSTIALLF